MAEDPIPIEDQFAEAKTTIAKLTEQNETAAQQLQNVTEQNETAAQQLQEQMQQVQQRLQNVTTSAITTTGQIVQMEKVLAEFERERHQLEGMLEGMRQAPTSQQPR